MLVISTADSTPNHEPTQMKAAEIDRPKLAADALAISIISTIFMAIYYYDDEGGREPRRWFAMAAHAYMRI